jgi:hypothetical protein
MRPPLSLLRLPPGIDIFRQLCIEEALFRSDARNWCGGRPYGLTEA